MAFPEPPDGGAIVKAIFATGAHELQTKQGCGRFTEACLLALDAKWPGAWMHLKKSGGQNQWNGHAVDGGVHAPTGYFVDMIGNSETAKASPSWHLDKVSASGGGPRYKGRADLFLSPHLDGVDPGPPPETHRYEGGGNDTGTCDTCGKPRRDAVHAVPEAKLPHEYDGGEQDTGVCDICGLVVDAVVHRGDSVERHAFSGTGGQCDRCGEPRDNMAFHFPVDPPAPDGVEAKLDYIIVQLAAIRARQDRPLFPVPEDTDGSQ